MKTYNFSNSQKKIQEWFTKIELICLRDDVVNNLSCFLINTPGFPVSSVNTQGYNALHIAAIYGNVDLIKFLITKGIDASARDKERNTALHLAAKYGHMRAVEYLFNSNPTEQFLNHLNRNLKSATGLAHIAKHNNIKEYLNDCATELKRMKPASLRIASHGMFSTSAKKIKDKFHVEMRDMSRIRSQDIFIQARAIVELYVNIIETCIHHDYFKVTKFSMGTLFFTMGGKAVNTSIGRFTVPHHVSDIYYHLCLAKGATSIHQIKTELLNACHEGREAQRSWGIGRSESSRTFYQAWADFVTSVNSLDAEPLRVAHMPCYYLLSEPFYVQTLPQRDDIEDLPMDEVVPN